MKWLLITLLLFLARLRVMGEENASDALARIAQRANSTKTAPMSREDSAAMATDVEIVAQHATENMPTLVDEFSKTGNQKSYRLLLHGVLLKKESLHEMNEGHLKSIVGVVGNSSEDVYLRIVAAKLTLAAYSENHLGRPSWAAEPIRKLAVSLMDDPKWKSTVRGDILKHMAGDKEIEDHLIGQIETDSDRDSLIWTLGKMRSQQSIPALTSLLASTEAGHGFHKARVYLALGEIGGESSFQALKKALADEKNSQEQRTILVALGTTKAPEAKDFLLDYLLHKPRDFYDSALDGLRFLGDRSVIPVLRDELSRAKNGFERKGINSTIQALEKGDDKPYW